MNGRQRHGSANKTQYQGIMLEYKADKYVTDNQFKNFILDEKL